MTARQLALKEPAAIFFIPQLLNSHGHYTMVIFCCRMRVRLLRITSSPFLELPTSAHRLQCETPPAGAPRARRPLGPKPVRSRSARNASPLPSKNGYREPAEVVRPGGGACRIGISSGCSYRKASARNRFRKDRRGL